MSFRPPGQYGPAPIPGLNPLDYEIAAEKAAALGRAGRKVEASLARLREHSAGHDSHDALRPEERSALLKEAAEAVHAYFIQRELCGMRRHEAVIREYDIPKAVLARLGAR